MPDAEMITTDGIVLVHKDADGETHVKVTGDHLGKRLGYGLDARLEELARLEDQRTYTSSTVRQT